MRCACGTACYYSRYVACKSGTGHLSAPTLLCAPSTCLTHCCMHCSGGAQRRRRARRSSALTAAHGLPWRPPGGSSAAGASPAQRVCCRWAAQHSAAFGVPHGTAGDRGLAAVVASWEGGSYNAERAGKASSRMSGHVITGLYQQAWIARLLTRCASLGCCSVTTVWGLHVSCILAHSRRLCDCAQSVHFTQGLSR